MKILIYIIPALLVATIFSGCKDIIEEDIEKKSIVVKTPSDNMISSVYSQVFWWEEMDGASKYRIEIVSPRFDSIITIVMDSTVTTTKITKTLNPGNYQWRIRGENGSYESRFQVYNLTILPASLNQQTITKTSPSNNIYFQSNSILFEWEPLYGATWYIIEIDSINGNGIPLKRDSTNESTEYIYNFDLEGDYKWRVRARNDAGEQTPWSSYWYTGYYQSTPPAPSPLSPEEGSTQSNPVLFNWSSVSRAKYYKLYVYIGPNDETPDIYTVNGTSKQSSFSSQQTISWKVSCVDKAGNESAASATKKFTSQ